MSEVEQQPIGPLPQSTEVTQPLLTPASVIEGDLQKKDRPHFSKFITCTIPLSNQLKLALKQQKTTNAKYVIEVTYLDTNGVIRKRKIKYGDMKHSDIKDINNGFLQKKRYYDRAKHLLPTLKKYQVTRSSFNVGDAIKEGWPLKKRFWEANLLYQHNDNIDKDSEMQEERLDTIVDTLLTKQILLL